MPNIIKIAEEAAVIAKDTGVGKEALSSTAKLASEAINSFQSWKIAKKFPEETKALNKMLSSYKEWLGEDSSLEIVTPKEGGAVQSPLTTENTQVTFREQKAIFSPKNEDSYFRLNPTDELTGRATLLEHLGSQLTAHHQNGVFGKYTGPRANISYDGDTTRIVGNEPFTFLGYVGGLKGNSSADRAIEHYFQKPKIAEPFITSGKMYHQLRPGEFEHDTPGIPNPIKNVAGIVDWSNGVTEVHTFSPNQGALKIPEYLRAGSTEAPYRFNEYGRPLETK